MSVVRASLAFVNFLVLSPVYNVALSLHLSLSELPHLRTRRPLNCGSVTCACRYTGAIPHHPTGLDILKPSWTNPGLFTLDHHRHLHAILFIDNIL